MKNEELVLAGIQYSKKQHTNIYLGGEFKYGKRSGVKRIYLR